jgi:hypothetical protein
VKLKISATVSPERLEQAKRLTGSDNVSEILDRGLEALITAELERAHAAGYERVAQRGDAVETVDPSVWADLPWDDE